MPQFDLTKYIPVHARTAEFYEKYPEGRIVTEIVNLNEETGFVCKGERFSLPGRCGAERDGPRL